MPRNKTTKICGFDKMNCYQKAEETIHMTKENSKDSPLGICNCMPACTSIQYSAEISQTFTNFDNYFNALGFSKESLK